MIICGKTNAEAIIRSISRLIDPASPPRLVAILVGKNPESEIYLNRKKQTCTEVGIKFEIIRLPTDIGRIQLSNIISSQNNDPDVHGILLQLPLPEHLLASEFLRQVNKIKDVDGLHPENLGLLLAGEPRFIPCTPWGCLKLIKTVCPDLTGKNAVVIGRSILIGKPIAMLLTNQNATVTLAHSRTVDLKSICRRADILVVAIGRPIAIGKDYVKKGAIVIDVGINKLPDGNICGDVNFEEVKDIADFITPVPGGVGPMTVANLVYNTYLAYRFIEFEQIKKNLDLSYKNLDLSYLDLSYKENSFK